MSYIKNKTLIATVNQDYFRVKLEHAAQYATLLTPYKLLRIHKITPYGFGGGVICGDTSGYDPFFFHYALRVNKCYRRASSSQLTLTNASISCKCEFIAVS